MVESKPWQLFHAIRDGTLALRGATGGGFVDRVAVGEGVDGGSSPWGVDCSLAPKHPEASMATAVKATRTCGSRWRFIGSQQAHDVPAQRVRAANLALSPLGPLPRRPNQLALKPNMARVVAVRYRTL